MRDNKQFDLAMYTYQKITLNTRYFYNPLCKKAEEVKHWLNRTWD
ncbi:hypothetical protein [Niallia circulans]|nr:hypothetical protein [Niallia circulans]